MLLGRSPHANRYVGTLIRTYLRSRFIVTVEHARTSCTSRTSRRITAVCLLLIVTVEHPRVSQRVPLVLVFSDTQLVQRVIVMSSAKSTCTNSQSGYAWNMRGSGRSLLI